MVLYDKLALKSSIMYFLPFSSVKYIITFMAMWNNGENDSVSYVLGRYNKQLKNVWKFFFKSKMISEMLVHWKLSCS